MYGLSTFEQGLFLFLEWLALIAQGLAMLGGLLVIFFIALIGYFIWTGDFNE